MKKEISAETTIAIGNQTAFSAAAPLDPWHFAVAQGFDAFEWFSDRKTDPQGHARGWDESALTEAECEQVCRVGKKKQIRYSIHAPWHANPLYADVLPRLRRSIEFAQAIQADLVNLHLYPEQGVEAFVDAISPVLDYAATRGIRISIENTPVTSPEAFNQTFSMLQQRGWGATHVGMCVDMGHANLFAETHHDYIAYIDRLAAHVPIIHLHMHENWGDRDTHMTLFTGPAAQNDQGVQLLLQRMITRGFAGAMILEQWPQPPAMLVQTRNRLLSMITHAQHEVQSASPKTKTSVAKAETGDPGPAVVDHFQSPALQSTPHGVLELMQQLVQLHNTQHSWRARLQWISEQLNQPKFAMSEDNLAVFVIYLKFLRAGQLSCAEDGRHFRPNHHAKAAERAVQALVQKLTPENAWLTRRIFPFLPSFDAAFQRSEPLTRIRNIAHRNDIPKELKHEIKHRLQNKLHRCAGPEDIITSREVLQRIQANVNAYSADFVEQFQTFHEELETFFNADSLLDRLKKIGSDFDAGLQVLVAQFLSCVEGLKSHATYEKQLEILVHAGRVRYALTQAFAGDAGAAAQQLRMLDIALEDYCFTVSSDVLNQMITRHENQQWQDAMLTIEILLENLCYSDIHAQHTRSLANEIQQWRTHFEVADQQHLLRLQASVERIMHFADRFAAQVLQLFTPLASALGSSLQVAPHAVQMFVEGDLRAHLVFQLSKFVAFLQQKLDERLDNRVWEVVVAGEAAGVLLKCNSLADFDPAVLTSLEIVTHGVVLWVDQLDGEEEVPVQVNAVLANNKIPHLSHFAVRARQACLPLAFNLQRHTQEKIEEMATKVVSIHAQQNEVYIQLEGRRSARPSAIAERIPVVAATVDLSIQDVLPLDAVRTESGGAKAAALHRLCAMSQDATPSFRVPPAVVLPFGFFEAQLQLQPALEKKYRTTIKQLKTIKDAQFDAWFQEQSALIAQLNFPAAMLKQLHKSFANKTRLAVRSSSNCEDLDHFAGAGLHASVLGVDLANIENAIKSVWVSLWRKIAVSSRRQAHIDQNSVHMAVIIQALVNADYSFFIHTHEPQVDGKFDPCCIIEMAVGLGETIASGTQNGQPYRFRYHFDSQAVEIVQYANFDWSLARASGAELSECFIDYAEIAMSNEIGFAHSLIKELGVVAECVATQMGKPQDIEGCVAGDTIYLVQTRAQQGKIT